MMRRALPVKQHPMHRLALLPAMLVLLNPAPAAADAYCDKLRAIVAAAPRNFAPVEAAANTPGHADLVDAEETKFHDVVVSLADPFAVNEGDFFGCNAG